MLETLFSRFITGRDKEDEIDEPETRRGDVRRECDKCVIVIGERLYPVENWSMGGFLIYGDTRTFGVNDEVDLTIKFKLRNDLMDVPHTARVVRKSNNKVAFQFKPLSQKIHKCFQSVIDDYVAAEFADSQLA